MEDHSPNEENCSRQIQTNLTAQEGYPSMVSHLTPPTTRHHRSSRTQAAVEVHRAVYVETGSSHFHHDGYTYMWPDRLRICYEMPYLNGSQPRVSNAAARTK